MRGRERRTSLNRVEKILRQRTEGGHRLEQGEREQEEEGRRQKGVHTGRLLGL